MSRRPPPTDAEMWIVLILCAGLVLLSLLIPWPKL